MYVCMYVCVYVCKYDAYMNVRYYDRIAQYDKNKNRSSGIDEE